MAQALMVLGIVGVLAAILGVYLVLHHRTQLRRIAEQPQPAEPVTMRVQTPAAGRPAARRLSAER